MLHLSSHFSITKFASERHPDLKRMFLRPSHSVQSGKANVVLGVAQKPFFWENLQGHFLDHLTRVNEILVAAGRPKLGEGAPSS